MKVNRINKMVMGDEEGGLGRETAVSFCDCYSNYLYIHTHMKVQVSCGGRCLRRKVSSHSKHTLDNTR